MKKWPVFQVTLVAVLACRTVLNHFHSINCMIFSAGCIIKRTRSLAWTLTWASIHTMKYHQYRSFRYVGCDRALARNFYENPDGAGIYDIPAKYYGSSRCKDPNGRKRKKSPIIKGAIYECGHRVCVLTVWENRCKGFSFDSLISIFALNSRPESFVELVI